MWSLYSSTCFTQSHPFENEQCLVVDAPSLERFEVRLVGALSNLI